MRYYLKEFKLFTPKFVTDGGDSIVDSCVLTEGEVFNVGSAELIITDLGDLLMITRKPFQKFDSLVFIITKDFRYATMQCKDANILSEIPKKELPEDQSYEMKDILNHTENNLVGLQDLHNASDYLTLVKDTNNKYYLYVKELINE